MVFGLVCKQQIAQLSYFTTTWNTFAFFDEARHRTTFAWQQITTKIGYFRFFQKIVLTKQTQQFSLILNDILLSDFFGNGRGPTGAAANFTADETSFSTHSASTLSSSASLSLDDDEDEEDDDEEEEEDFDFDLERFF